MALTITLKKVFVIGDRKEVHADITFDNSYPTGGEPLTGADVGLEGELNLLEPVSMAKNAAGTSAVPLVYDYTNGKMQAYRYNGASAGVAFLEEVAATVDLSTFTARVRAVGKGKAAV